MKIRIKGNSLRYRLTKPEVATLAQKGKLEEKTEFISATITYTIEQTDENHSSADFVQDNIKLFVPLEAIQNWASTDQVEIAYNMPLGNGKSLYLLLEKDFKCMDGDVNEDQSDYFENPKISC